MNKHSVYLFHGSRKRFENFEERFSYGSVRRAVLGAFWFTDNLKVAKSYGSIIYETWIDLGNTFIIDANFENYSEIYLSSLPQEICNQIDRIDNKRIGDTYNLMEYYKKTDHDFSLRFDAKDLAVSAMRAGFDSLIIKNVIDAGNRTALNIFANTYAVFDSKRIIISNVIEKNNVKRCRMVG